jgi:hypothetical protein
MKILLLMFVETCAVFMPVTVDQSILHYVLNLIIKAEPNLDDGSGLFVCEGTILT